MTTHHADHGDTADHMNDPWLEVIGLLAPGNRIAGTFPPDGPLAHTTGPAGEILLRRWPAEASGARIAFTARALDLARPATGDVIPTIEPVPARPGERSVLVQGHRYTRSPFLPGRPLGRYGNFRTPSGATIDVPLHESTAVHDLIADVAGTLARAHQATTSVAVDADAPVWTLADMLHQVREIWFTERKVLGARAAGQRDIRRWLRCGNRIVPTCSDLLRSEPRQLRDRSVVVHGNLWPAHILIEGREEDRAVTGIVGWTAAAAGSPILDLAALSVRMRGWSAALTESVVESYAAVAPLTPEQRRLVPAVAALDLVARVAWLLTLSYVDDRMIDHPALPVLRSGMKTLLDALEVLTNILVPESQERRWQRAGREAKTTPARGERARARGDAPRRPIRRPRSSKDQRNRQ